MSGSSRPAARRSPPDAEASQVNVIYGDVRVGLSPWEREFFLSDAHGLADYRAVLLLLAIDTGAPKVATPFFNTIRELVSSIPLEPPREKKGKAGAQREGLKALLDRLIRRQHQRTRRMASRRSLAAHPSPEPRVA